MSDESIRENAASDYWAALEASAGGADPVGELDPETANALRHLYRLTLTPPPAGARERVDRHMERRLAARSNGQYHMEQNGMNQTQILTQPHPAVFARERGPGSLTVQTTHARRPIRWHSLHMAVAAVLLFGLALGYLAFNPFGGSPDRPSSIPAAVAPAETPTARVDTLLTTTFPVESRPASPTLGWLTRLTVAPGTTIADPSWRAGSRISFEYVVAGSESIVSSSAGWLLRADENGVATTTAPGEQVTLNPGDALMLTPHAADAPNEETRHNPESTPLVLLTGGVAEDAAAGPTQQNPGITIDELGLLSADAWQVPTGSIQIKLQRVTILPDAVFTLPINAKIVAGGLGSSDKIVQFVQQQWIVGRAMDTSGAIVTSDPLVTVPDPRGDSVRNDGSTPVVVLMLVFSSTGADEV